MAKRGKEQESTKVIGAEVAEVSRKEINPAPYNPRTMTSEAEAKLRKSLEAFGLADLPVWNKRTGNLVGGHQRLRILDDKHGEDYAIRVSVVDLDGPHEKMLNVALNNQKLAGDFDYAALAEVLTGLKFELPNIEFDLTGFDNKNIQSIIDTPKDNHPPSEFASYDIDIHIDYSCPRCGYKWSGKKNNTE